MGLEILTLGSSKTYTRESLLGGGAVVGKNVTVSSITPIDGGNKVTFSYTLDNGTVKTSTMDVMDGKDGIDGLPGKDGKDGKDGQQGADGSDGIGISKIEKIGTVDLVDTYRITFTDNSTFDYEVKNGKDGQGGSGGSGEENKIDSISVNGVNVVPDENKNVDITVPDAYDDTDIRTELANKADTDHTHTTVNGHTVESDVPVDAKFTDTVYDDTQVKTAIQTVANGLMDSVGYSADYKSIDIIAKNGVKKSVNVAPIISHASITELSDVDTTNKATGKALVYNATTSKHEYADVSGTDEKVKMDASTDAKYLGELLDNITIANENGELKVKKLDGQEVTITEINYLKGLTMNVMDLVNMFSNGGVKIINTPVATYAELLTLDKSSFIEGVSYLVYVLADENHDNAKTTYLVDKNSETPTYFGFADSQRDFTTNPIDLATEITGKLGISNMDSDAIKALFTVDDTYKTETATNNAFSTHGAKALYDELLLAIGNKANDSDLTAHKDDADIHVSTEDRTKWDSAKTHADSAHAPSNAQANVLETVKVNDTALTPSNKAVNVTVPTTVAELTDSADYAKTTDIPTTLPANGGNSDTATKLATARTINDASFDGSASIRTANSWNFSLGHALEETRYAIFARTPSSNSNDNCGATLLVTDCGSYGGTLTGAWLIQISNRGSVPTMDVTVLRPQNKGTVTFGYYKDTENGHFYFGVYTTTFRSDSNITVLRNNRVTIQKFSDSMTKPSGWTLAKVRTLQDEKGTIANATDLLKPLEISDIAGGKNLLNPKYFTSQILKAGGTGNIDELSWNCDKVNKFTEDLSGISFKENTIYTIVLYGKCKNEDNLSTNLAIEYTDGTKSSIYFKTKNTNSVTLFVTPGNKTISKFVFMYGSTGTDLEPKKCGIFEGVIKESDFEPYIPSVKMLADENVQQNTEAMDLKMLGWTVPKECPIQNYTDANGVFHQRVGRVDLGSLTWEPYDTNTSGKYRMGSSGISTLVKKPSSNSTKFNGYCSKYSVITSDNAYACITGIGVAETSGNVYVYDENYTERDGTSTFKTAMSGVYLYYELATEKTKNVDGNEAVTKVNEAVAKANENLSIIGKCKNFFNAKLPATTSNGVTCTNNGDGTYTVNGTARNDNVWFISSEITGLKNGVTYKIIGDPSGVVHDLLYSYIYDTTAKKSTNPILGQHTFVYDSSHKYDFRIKVAQNQTASNMIFKPMLTTNLNATYDDFVPYTGDGETLSADVAELKNDIVSLNLLASPYDSSMTYNIGDFCYYANNIYQCKTKISEPESFSSNKWKQTVIGDYLAMTTPYTYCSKTSSVSIDLSKYMANYEVIIGSPKKAAGISSYIGRYWVNISNVPSASDIFAEQDSQVVSSITLSNNILNIEFTAEEYHTVVIRLIKRYTPS